MANTTKPAAKLALSVTQYCKRTRKNAKVVRRQLRSLGIKRPVAGWTMTPSVLKRLADARA